MNAQSARGRVMMRSGGNELGVVGARLRSLTSARSSEGNLDIREYKLRMTIIHRTELCTTVVESLSRSS